MVELPPLKNPDELGRNPGPDAMGGAAPADSKRTRPFWHFPSWLSLEALGWYLLVVLVVAVFAPARSVLKGDRGRAEAWGKLQGEAPEVIDWQILEELDSFNQTASDRLAALDGRIVALPGYLIPLDEDFERATEFLMVPYFGACTHVPPPPENQMVHVRLQGKIGLDSYGWDPVWIAGRLHIRDTEMVFGSAAYQMEGLAARAYSLADGSEE